MQHPQYSGKTRKVSRGAAPLDSVAYRQQATREYPLSSGMHPQQLHYLNAVNQSQYYAAVLPSEQQPYMLPYTTYQQPTQYHGPPALLESYPQAVAFQTQHMPPLKRPRMEMRNASSAIQSPSQSASRNVSRMNKSGPTKIAAASRKTHSDFRISSIKIGTWFSDETKGDSESRDSKIRFCFRNSGDRDAPSTLSADEAALVSPDRLSISVSRGTRRIIIPAHHIKSVEFRRAIGEIVIRTDGWAAFENLTNLSTETSRASNNSPSPSQSVWTLTEEDVTSGQLSSAKEIIINLDLHKPLTEPKWTRGNLEDHIDPSSRFVRITKIVDSESEPSFDQFLTQWAADDAEKAYFCEYHLDAGQLLKVLIYLMSNASVLTPALTCLLEGMSRLLSASDTPQADVIEVIKSALLLVPNHMLFVSLDALYSAFEIAERASAEIEPLMAIEGSYAGSKRQRGESEVPSDQLAKTTLDEKRRRLSDSEPQTPAFRNQNKIQPIVRGRGRAPDSEEKAIASMVASKSQDPVSRNLLQASTHSSTHRTRSEGSSFVNDGARLSREELLRELEIQEALESSSDPDCEADDASPIESGSVMTTFESSHDLIETNERGQLTDRVLAVCP